MCLIHNTYILILCIDCSGGYSSSMLDAMRQALQVSNVLALDRDQDYQRLSYKEAFRMATLGGAKGKEQLRVCDMHIESE